MAKGIKIDYDRGVSFQLHPKTGMNIYMYKDAPGHYINAFGSPVSDALAREAGFDIERFGKEKIKRERMAIAMGAIERELEAQGDAKPEPVYEKAGFKVYDIGLGRHNVVDPDGNQLNASPLSREIADVLIRELTPKEEDAPEEKEDVIPLLKLKGEK